MLIVALTRSYSAQLSSLLREMTPTLENFHACVHLGGDGFEVSPDDVCFVLMSLLVTTHTRSVKLDLRPASFTKGGYGVSRHHVIDALVASCAHPMFEEFREAGQLPVFELSLFDETFAHDSIWWSTTLSSPGRQMSRCWGDISVEVEHSCELRVTSAVCGVSETDPTGFSKMFNNCGLANQTHKALG